MKSFKHDSISRVCLMWVKGYFISPGTTVSLWTISCPQAQCVYTFWPWHSVLRGPVGFYFPLGLIIVFYSPYLASSAKKASYVKRAINYCRTEGRCTARSHNGIINIIRVWLLILFKMRQTLTYKIKLRNYYRNLGSRTGGKSTCGKAKGALWVR